MSNIEEIKQLHGLEHRSVGPDDLEVQFWDEEWKEKGGETQHWPTSLEDRLSFSK